MEECMIRAYDQVENHPIWESVRKLRLPEHWHVRKIRRKNKASPSKWREWQMPEEVSLEVGKSLAFWELNEGKWQEEGSQVRGDLVVLLDLGLCSENSKKTIEINRQGSDTSRFVFRPVCIPHHGSSPGGGRVWTGNMNSELNECLGC